MLIASLMGAVAFQKAWVSCIHWLIPYRHYWIRIGLANAVNIPYGMAFNIAGFENKFRRVREPELKVNGEAVVNYLFELNSKISIPHKLQDIGVKQGHVETLADLAIADFAHQ
jgi:alcohol dehydrogenase class IV